MEAADTNWICVCETAAGLEHLRHETTRERQAGDHWLTWRESLVGRNLAPACQSSPERRRDAVELNELAL